MYKRECKRRDGGHAIMVPKLREIHIYHQRFMDLTLAKIMHMYCASCCIPFVARVGF